MKKRKMKQILALALSLTMVMTVAGCGKDGGSTGDGGQGGAGGAGGNAGGAGSAVQQAADPSVAKQHVFRESEFQMPSALNGTDLNSIDVIDDLMYMVTSKYNYDEETYEGTYAFYMASMNKDGSNVSVKDMDADFPENWYINSSFFSEKSKAFYGVVSYSYSEDSDNGQGGDNVVIYDEDDYYYGDYGNWVTVNTLAKWNLDGALEWNTELTSNGGDSWSYARDIFEDSNGGVVILMDGETAQSIQVSAAGELVSTKEIDQEALYNTDYFITAKNGKLYTLGYNDDWTKYMISEYDMNTGKTSNGQEVPYILRNGQFYKGASTDFVVSTNMGLYTYNVGDTEAKEMLNFLNSDITTSYFNRVMVLDDQNVVASYWDESNGWGEKMSKFTYVDPKDIPDKKALVLGCNWLDGSIKSGIVKFNKSSNDYRITVIDYSQYNTDDDYMAGVNKLNNDIISGNMPDILIPDTYSMDIDSYLSKGLLADIKQLIANDSELSSKEYLTNVFDAFTKDGVMYALPTSFNVQTMVAKTSLVGHPEKFTMEDANKALSKMASGAQVFGNTTREGYLYQAMNYSGNQFIDKSTGKCNFNSQEFVDVLNAAKQFPEEFGDDYWNEYDYEEYQVQWRENKTLLYDAYIYSISDLVYQIKGMMGDEVTFVGFPGAQGSGSVLSASGSVFCISAKSSNIDGAWQFIRYYLTDEYQASNENWGLPVSKAAFEAKAKEATQKPYWTDENGEKVEYDQTYWINNEEIILEPFTQAEVDEICNFIYSVTDTVYYSEEIMNIINEEAAPFFAGQKNAESVANILQSRIEIMLAEGM